MSYTNSFILVADDCPATTGVVPSPKAGKPTIAVLEHEILSSSPYKLTQEELILRVYARRNGLTAQELKAQAAAIRATLFAKPHPCMRASPLPKTFGWGVHHDEQGRIGIFAVGSTEYARLAKSKSVTVLKAMRSKRA